MPSPSPVKRSTETAAQARIRLIEKAHREIERIQRLLNAEQAAGLLRVDTDWTGVGDMGRIAAALGDVS